MTNEDRDSPTLLHDDASTRTPLFWERVRVVFQEVVSSQPEDRQARLSALAEGDRALEDEVQSLLQAHDASGEFIELEPRPSFIAEELIAGRYRAIRPLGEGGMGAVIEAEDRELHEHVALKMIRPHIAGDPQTLLRFRREIQLARRVTHPNVCRIYDVSSYTPAAGGGRPSTATLFVSMELLAGITLAERLREGGPMSRAEAVPIIRQLAAGLSAAHDVSIVHRDFKSSNVMLVPPSGSSQLPRAVITDFGLAHQTDHAGGERLTQTGAMVGTPEYMAPEQLEDGPITAATDIYALGIVMYEMFTGRLPFSGSTPIAIAVSRLHRAAPSPRQWVPSLDARVEEVILRCLERSQAARFQRATDVADALDETNGQARRVRASGSPRAALGWLALPIAAVAALALYLNHRPITPAAQSVEAQTSLPTTVAPSFQPRRSVAVLGFQNMAGGSEASWLAIAMAEMLTSELSASERLRVVSGEVMAPLRTDLASSGPSLEAGSVSHEVIQRVRQRTGSDVVVFGSYLVAGEGRESRIRLDVRLEDAVSGETLGAFTESGAQADLLDLVSRTGNRLRGALGTAPLTAAQSATVRASQPSDPEAARAYFDGLEQLRRFDAMRARALFEKTVAREPAFVMGHSALAEAFWSLGYEKEARETSMKAMSLSTPLGREERLLIEARSEVMQKHWDQAVEIYSSLFTFFPDEPRYGIRLGLTQIAAAKGTDAFKTVSRLRKLPSPLSDDPAIDVVEADAAQITSDPKRELLVARNAERKGKASGSRVVVARALANQSFAMRDLGKLDESVRLIEQAIVILDSIGDRGGSARATTNLATSLYQRGDLKSAKAAYERALAIQRAMGNRTFEARTLSNLGNVIFAQGDAPGAEKVYREALVIEREVDYRALIPSTLSNIGAMREVRGDLMNASQLFKEAASEAHRNGDLTAELLPVINGGEVLRLLGSLEESGRVLSEALIIARKISNPQQESYVLAQLGEIALAKGDLTRARTRHEEALAIRKKTGEKLAVGQSLVMLANLSIEAGMPSESVALTRQGIAMAAEAQASEDEALAHETLARAMLAQSKLPAAMVEIQHAAVLAKGSQTQSLIAAIRTTEARLLSAQGSQPAARTKAKEAVAVAGGAQLLGIRLEAELTLASIEAARGDNTSARQLRKSVEAAATAHGLKLIARKAKA